MSIPKASLLTCLPQFQKRLQKPICQVAVACLLLGLSGCVTSGGGAMTKVWQQVKSPFGSTTVAAKKEMKSPGNLKLSYAQWQEEIGNLVEAQESYENVIKANPRSVDAIVGLARIDQLAGRTYKAQKGYKKALQINPNDPQALDAMGQFYASQQRWDDAVDVLNKAMLAGPGEPLYRFHLAVAKTKQGDIQGALPLFTRTVGEAEGHFNVGRILMSEGKIPEAGSQFQLALMKKPGLVDAQRMLEELRSQYPNNTQLARATQRNTTSPTSADFEQRRNQSAYQPANNFRKFRRGSDLSAPAIQSRNQYPAIQPATYSGNDAGHSTFPASLEQANQGMVNPPDFQPRNFSNETNRTGLTPAQSEQLRNQFHSNR